MQFKELTTIFLMSSLVGCASVEQSESNQSASENGFVVKSNTSIETIEGKEIASGGKVWTIRAPISRAGLSVNADASHSSHPAYLVTSSTTIKTPDGKTINDKGQNTTIRIPAVDNQPQK